MGENASVRELLIWQLSSGVQACQVQKILDRLLRPHLLGDRAFPFESAARGEAPLQARTIASASPVTSWSGTSSPVTPSVTSSSMLAPRVPMTGIPSSKLSIAVFGRLSMIEGMIAAAAPRKTV